MQTEVDPKQELSNVLASIDCPDQMMAFLKDLCTPGEFSSMAERWRIVNMVNEGVSYRQIGTQIGASTATVTRVARALVEGKGYRSLLTTEDSSNV